MEDEPHKNTKYAMDSPKSSLPVTGWVWDMFIGLIAREKKEQKKPNQNTKQALGLVLKNAGSMGWRKWSSTWDADFGMQQLQFNFFTVLSKKSELLHLKLHVTKQIFISKTFPVTLQFWLACSSKILF